MLVVLSGVLLGVFLAALEQTIIATALPTMAGQLGGAEHLAWVVTAYLLAFTAATPIYGRLGDLYGRRRMILSAIVIFTLGSIGCGAAQDMLQLVLARAVQGIGGGGLITLSQATVGDIVSPRERGRYQAYIAGTWATASIGGPLLGGLFVDFAGWRWIFWVNLPLAALAFAVCWSALKRLPRARGAVSIDYLGILLFIPGVSALLLVATWGGSRLGWTSPLLLGLVALGVVLLAAFAAWERQAREPVVPLRLFRNAVFRITGMSSFLAAMAIFSITVFLPLGLQLARGMAPSVSGLMMLPFTAAAPLGALVTGRMMLRTGRYKPMPLIGLAMAALGSLGMSALGPSTPVLFVGLATAVLGFGLGLTFPAMLVAVQNAVERSDLGSASSAIAFARSMGGAYGVAIMSSILLAALPASTPLGPALHGGPAALLLLPEAERGLMVEAVAGSLERIYLACAGVLALAFLVTLRLENRVLRSASS